MINGNNSYAQSIGTTMQNTEGVFLKEPVTNVYTEQDEGKVVNNGELVAQTASSTTSNGTVDTTTINSLEVDVANSYSQADNGKVVSNQELVAQTAYPTEITENDTYDTTNYNSITVNVSGGGGSSYAAMCVFIFDSEADNRIFYYGDNVSEIEDSYFIFASPLDSVTIYNSVTRIGYGAFQQSSLSNITFESNSNLERIEPCAFQGCYLTSITIPNSVTYIGYDVFNDCSVLSSITFESTTPPELEGELGITTDCVIRIPQGTLSDYTSAANYPDPSEYIYEEY